MAKEDAKKFFEHVDRDPELQKELKHAAKGIVDLAAKKGYHFSQRDMAEHMKERSGLKHSVQFADPDTCCVF